MMSALFSFLQSRVSSHLAQAFALSMLSASKNRCGIGANFDPLESIQKHDNKHEVEISTNNR